jgi:hypothetical protein
MQETEHKALQKRHCVPLLLNLAAVQLKLGEYRAAIKSCDEVHMWENAHRLSTTAEVWNAKMLYRRGSAFPASPFNTGAFQEGSAEVALRVALGFGKGRRMARGALQPSKRAFTCRFQSAKEKLERVEPPRSTETPCRTCAYTR